VSAPAVADLPPVLYEDEALIAFDKPAGLPISPDRWNKALPCLVRLIHQRLSPEIFNAHRIDRDVSGVVLCAKSRADLHHVCRQFERGEVVKEYVGLVRGSPPEPSGRIRLPIAPDPRKPGRVVIAEGGKPAATEYAVLRRLGPYSLLHLRPLTGRTHQIRVHLDMLGCPLVADPWYGGGRPLEAPDGENGGAPRLPIARPALHAAALELRHPRDDRRLRIEAPWPADLLAAVERLSAAST